MATNDARDLNLSIDKEELRPLYEVKPFRVWLAYITEWTVIIATMYFAWQYFNVLTYLIAITIIGSRMHALACVMHDAAHFRFLKNRKWSDLITDVFVCFPMLVNVDGYRRNHLGHHQHLNTDEDPDWVAKLGRPAFEHPQTKTQFLGRLFLYFIGYQGIADLRWMTKRVAKDKKTPEQKRQMLIFYVILLSSLTIFGWWKFYLIFWIVPFFTTFMMFQYIRSFAEHFGDLEYTNLLTSTRSVKPYLLERIIIAPYNISYHLEHHLYPGVPFYHLPRLRKVLEKDPEYLKNAHYSRGYFVGLLNEL